ncbi:MAG: AbrB/MazE/SpoVT family DNA-binding domain-containing protein [Coxiellaceae bacterium]|nr:AbrB/MazE/SpoVT family DNA-binding domain-containing protein [Coxiellaceae bacterium]
MQITSKGQVTIPLDIRTKFGLLPHTQVEFIEKNGKVYLEKVAENKGRGRKLIDSMRNKATVNLSTDEIMALTRDRN